MTEVQSERLLARVSFRDLGSSDLFSDYCEANPKAVTFYGKHFLDRTEIQRTIDSVRSSDTAQRKILTDVLEEQNVRWQAPRATIDNIERLRSANATVVVTGQQLGLFVSPLYTIYKTLTAIKLARSWSTDTAPVVPIFWMADEDHDLAEIARAVVPSRHGRLADIRFPRNADTNLVPTGRLVLDEHIEDAIDRLEAELPATDDSATLLSAVRACYRPGTSYADAFAKLLHVLLPDSGIVIISGDDARLKGMATGLFRKAIEQTDFLHDRLVDASEVIASRYHAQLRLRNTNLFIVQDGMRRGIDRVKNGFVISGSGKVLSESELIARLESEPEAFSPNVVLRPLYQDSILPTAAYVGGPGEVAYFGQIRCAYEWAGVEMPIIYPRASISLVDGSARRLLDAHDLDFADLRKRPEVLLGDVVRQTMSLDVAKVMTETAHHLDATFDTLAESAKSVQDTLGNSVDAIRKTAHKRLARLEKKIIREEKRNHSVTASRINRSTSFLYPEGKPQERMLLPAYFIARYGADYFVRLMGDVDEDTSRHLVLKS